MTFLHPQVMWLDCCCCCLATDADHAVISAVFFPMLLLLQSPALNASLLSLLCNIGKSSCPSQHAPDPTQAPHQARTPTATTPAASTGQLLGSTAAAAAAASKGSYQNLPSGSSSRAGLQINSSGSSKPAGAGLGSAAALAAAAAVPQCPGRLQLPTLGWGLCSPYDGLLQPAWVWLLAPGERLCWPFPTR
jgi:hypothetical protein